MVTVNIPRVDKARLQRVVDVMQQFLGFSARQSLELDASRDLVTACHRYGAGTKSKDEPAGTGGSRLILAW